MPSKVEVHDDGIAVDDADDQRVDEPDAALEDIRARGDDRREP
jgi:hypothetical protein